MTRFRWWLFKKLSALGWWICPDLHKGKLQRLMPRWEDYSLAEASRRADRSMEKLGKAFKGY